ncbi:MAG: carbonic anhydrase [Marmoricola sp.]|jgi:carbonic anhydrase/acetyltransferase-like protein (isoleucine patch superfamily)|nr:carbonic anhydrase [Marmoricola sp.]
MPLYSFEGTSPTVHPSAFIAANAVLVGDVVVEANASVWYGAILRGDYAQIAVREGANVQDGSVLHAAPDLPCIVGPGATIAHLCVVHSATIGEEALIGNHATVLDGAKIGRRTLVAAGSLVVPGSDFPDEVLVIGSPAKVKGPIAGTASEFWIAANPQAYRDLAQRHLKGVAEVSSSGPRPGWSA